jgi:hypothetical protein
LATHDVAGLHELLREIRGHSTQFNPQAPVGMVIVATQPDPRALNKMIGLQPRSGGAKRKYLG